MPWPKPFDPVDRVEPLPPWDCLPLPDPPFDPPIGTIPDGPHIDLPPWDLPFDGPFEPLEPRVPWLR